MEKRSLQDGTDSFEVSMFETPKPSRVVLFAVGGGGNPERQHAPLLAALAARGCSIVAPHFERLPMVPSEDDLLTRARRLRLALDAVVRPGVSVAGVGHSLGAMLLIAFAGGQAWMREGHKLQIAPDSRIERIALMAPAVGYFQAPSALDAVRIPILAWAAGGDTIAPPSQAQYLKRELGDRAPVDLRVAEGAGHFSFLNTLPPQVSDPLDDREAFLAHLTSEVGDFVLG
jgi:alpha-beta hydrolase superfamily lysophospholipase